MSLITIVVPVRNEIQNLQELTSRLKNVTTSMTRHEFEIIYIDNGSTDGSTEFIKRMCSEYNNCKFIKFTRDFGIEASFDAGARNAKGDALIYLFSDLQDPPEIITNMVKLWEDGYELVYGKLKTRNDSIVFKSIGAKFAYKLISKLTSQKIPENATDFRLLSRKLIDYLNSFEESSRYMRGITHWSGMKSNFIEYDRAPRKHGQSKAGLVFCFRYAIDAISSFSTKPLRLSAIMGLILMTLSILLSILYVGNSLLAIFSYQILPLAPPGWSTLVILSLFFGGVNSFLVGILGEYIAKIHIEVKRRPLWHIRDMDLKE